MSRKVTLGGERLGTGNKMKVDLKSYDRSTFNLKKIWQSTMACGTLVPFIKELAMPGDSLKFKLDVDVKTHPTIGPLFNSFKLQLDLFQVPIRLYQKLLIMNKLNIGLKMKDVYLPQIQLEGPPLQLSDPLDDQQINSSCILSYLDIRGVGRGYQKEGNDILETKIERHFNAVPFLGYWDIVKNYYANQQEGEVAYIHSSPKNKFRDVKSVKAVYGSSEKESEINKDVTILNPNNFAVLTNNVSTDKVYIQCDPNKIINPLAIRYYGFMWYTPTPPEPTVPLEDMGVRLLEVWERPLNWTWDANEERWEGTYFDGTDSKNYLVITGWTYDEEFYNEGQPIIKRAPIGNIDAMRERLLRASDYQAYTISKAEGVEPYIDILEPLDHESFNPTGQTSLQNNQEGLALKTYLSDLHNNWLAKESIEGSNNSIAELTAVDTSEGYFNIDTLNLAKKVYELLNRVAVSGTSYYDWLNAVYDHEFYTNIHSPMYIGGLSNEIVFQEVISNAEASDQPLGTLAGRGVSSNHKQGGYIDVRIDEPCYIIGIASITPRITYSQGNKWDTSLQTLDDLHKPQLDQIGFQDLPIESMGYWGTIQDTSDPINNPLVKLSAGKQPAWINYMTNINETRGNFAVENNQMFMTLNRRYEASENPLLGISDLTTYIDPAKYNHIFAQTSRDAQNFWVQIAVDLEARRKMSSKLIPNL